MSREHPAKRGEAKRVDADCVDVPRARRGVASALMHELRLVGVALQFLTRVPLCIDGYDPAWLPASARHFPLVGAFVGVFGAVVLYTARTLWPSPVAVVLSMAATVWLTGAFHEDGLADSCDALGGAVTRERALAIMKDSRLGSYGALGLVLVLALKAGALWTLAGESVLVAAAALVPAHAFSRACAVSLLAALPYAGEPARAKAPPMAARGSRVVAAVALAWSVVIVIAMALVLPRELAPARLLVALACACAATFACALQLRRRLGGCTGDGLGAAQQCSEVAFYLALAALPFVPAHT